MAIANFTPAEWNALCSAIALQDCEWEDPDAPGGGAQSRAALARALLKARQLAPERPSS